MDAVKQFEEERARRIASNGTNERLKRQATGFLQESLRAQYSYNFSWLGRPIIQYPEDLLAVQQIVWRVKPDLFIETGIAHGGSILYHASLLELLGGDRRVLAIDIDIRAHNRAEIEAHPLFHRITMVEGSSLDEKIAEVVRAEAAKRSVVMLVLDSNHTHDHVLGELELYAPLVSVGSYAIVFDGIIEQMSDSFSSGRPWGPGDNPLTATRAFLAENADFVVDEEIDNQLLITAAPSGYLRRVR